MHNLHKPIMQRTLAKTIAILAFSFAWMQAVPQQVPLTQVPRQIWGTWRIAQIISTRTISCFDEKQARSLLGTQVYYSAQIFRWRNLVTKKFLAATRQITAQQFMKEYYGGPADSQVDFKQLGIKKPSVSQITLTHAEANIFDGTIEIPGDQILVKDTNTIIISVCNIYFKAFRVQSYSSK
jgi:hypothetical protein